MLPSSLEPLATWRAASEINLPAPEQQKQKWWNNALMGSRRNALVNTAAGRDVNRLEAMQFGQGGGGWMLNPPTMLSNSCMPSSDYAALLKWQLGIPLIPIVYSGQRCAACGRPVDPFATTQ